ncbi:mechanosensitive ion channel [Flavobacteriaceae bacterium Ap0902]|nr:mechanosensitive ion channel [Flavobacteriaceae bacterium Ap0902]
MIKGEWSTVEDLRYTYVIIKTWDSRRLIVPMKYLIEETIENWSHSKMNTSSGIYFSVDYTADVEAIREHFKKLVNDHPLWNKQKEPKVLVTNSGEDTITIRCVVSSDTPNNAWEMECDIREKILVFLNKHKEMLPRERHIIYSAQNKSEG